MEWVEYCFNHKSIKKLDKSPLSKLNFVFLRLDFSFPETADFVASIFTSSILPSVGTASRTRIYHSATLIYSSLSRAFPSYDIIIHLSE